ncbi:hypothetical protein, partial [Okeania sp. SIO2B9]|uniref:hypothetical protein n=1 Tax=Okeania sp. SIO2B9 TaxID=2607782 RepID=UPI001429826E
LLGDGDWVKGAIARKLHRGYVGDHGMLRIKPRGGMQELNRKFILMVRKEDLITSTSKSVEAERHNSTEGDSRQSGWAFGI